MAMAKCTNGHIMHTQDTSGGVIASCEPCGIALTHVSVLLREKLVDWVDLALMKFQRQGLLDKQPAQLPFSILLLRGEEFNPQGVFSWPFGGQCRHS